MGQRQNHSPIGNAVILRCFASKVRVSATLPLPAIWRLPQAGDQECALPDGSTASPEPELRRGWLSCPQTRAYLAPLLVAEPTETLENTSCLILPRIGVRRSGWRTRLALSLRAACG